MELSIVNIIILILFIPAIWSGISKGFVRQAAGLAALILGIWGAYTFGNIVSDYLTKLFEIDHKISSIIAFASLFFIIIVIVKLIGKLAEKLIKLVLLGWLDKLLGVVFAILKTAIILSIVIYLFNSVDELWSFLPKEELHKSQLYNFLEAIAPKIFPYFKGL